MMKPDTSSPIKLVKYVAVAACGLMVAGIVTLMVLARGTGEDITGVVSPAALIAIVSGVVAIMAFIAERREPGNGKSESDTDRTS